MESENKLGLFNEPEEVNTNFNGEGSEVGHPAMASVAVRVFMHGAKSSYREMLRVM